ncbi:formin-like protein 13 [Triticum aestivum]|uniref:formin-like protein 13 n=1 Tax=Triticum aestivum TaxID=4565 RepID=UPI001D02EE2D|nr:formin-like protein 13 [Triticum aestivum]
MDKDGILCCHILKVFTHVGVDVIPERYLLRRWTPTAVPSAPETGYEQPDEMPPQSKKRIRERNMIYDFRKLAKFASGSDLAQAIVYKHMRAALMHICDVNPQGPPPPPGCTRHPPPPPPPHAPPNGPTGSTQGARRLGDANPQRPPPPPGPTSSALCATPNGPTGRTQGAHNPGDYNPSTMTGRATAGDCDGPTAPLEAASLAQASDDFVPRDPPRSTTKGRAKSRRYKSALELHPKKKNKCSQCHLQSTLLFMHCVKKVAICAFVDNWLNI